MVLFHLLLTFNIKYIIYLLDKSLGEKILTKIKERV